MCLSMYKHDLFLTIGVTLLRTPGVKELNILIQAHVVTDPVEIEF